MAKMISLDLTRVKLSLSVVNFKRRIASFAWRASSSALAQRTRPSCIQHCLLLNAWRASRPTFAGRGYPSAAFYAAKLSPAPQHFASRQAPAFPRRLRAEPKINGRLSDARLDKPWFALKAQVFADGSASATTLACTSLYASSLLAKPFFPVTLAGTVLRKRNAPTAATSARAYGSTSCPSLCSLSLSSAVTLAGAVLRERNAPTAASSARANDN